jgi:hypothetical protein
VLAERLHLLQVQVLESVTEAERRIKPADDAPRILSPDLQQPQGHRVQELEAEVQRLKAQLAEATAKLQKKGDEIMRLENDLKDNQRLALNQQLEQLFLSTISFSSFYEAYLLLIDGINETLPRPVNYYYSISATKKMISQPNELKSKFVTECIEHFKLGISEENFIELCIDKQYILKNKEAVATFYYKLGKFNLIRIDAIPHLLRKTPKIEQLFKEYGAENILPQFNPTYDLFSKADVHLKEFNDTFTFLQLVNHFSFSGFANSITLQGIELTKLNKDKLLELLNKHYYFHQSIINFVDQWGNIKQPMVNSSDFVLNFNEIKSDTDYSIIFLNYFGRQDYRMFNKNGRLIKEEGSYDFKLEKYKDVYTLWSHDSKYVCVKYISEINILIKKEINTDVFIENMPIDSSDIPVLHDDLFFPNEKEELYKIILFPAEVLKNNNVVLSEIAFNQIELNAEINQVAKFNYQNNAINYEGLRNGLIANRNFHSIYFQEIDCAPIQPNISLKYTTVLKNHVYQVIISNNNTSSENYLMGDDQIDFLKVYNDFITNYSNDNLLIFLQSRGLKLIQKFILNEEKIIEFLNKVEDELLF